MTPTNYDSNTNSFDTSSVESVVDLAVKCEPDAYIVIKSTIPVGFVERIRLVYETDRIAFSPEFLRRSGFTR